MPDVLIVRLTQPEQFRRIARDLDMLFADFLKRSGEPFTTEQQWDALSHALAQGEGTLFLVAFDQRVRPVGFLLAQSGTDYWRIVCAFVRQLYVRPRTPRTITEEFERRLLEWARAQDATIIAAGTTRNPNAFLRRFPNFTKYSTTFVRILREDANAERATADRTDDHRPEPLPAV